ncbi:unnamed protein product [Closterium sp. NIES-65]|nr:unnamed protein product [Closterium sp. NIES-65]
MGDGGDYENGGEEGYAEKGQGYDGEGNAYAGEGGEEGQGAGYINQEGEEFGQDMEGGEGFAEEEENWQEGEAEDVYAMGAGMGNGPEGEEGFAEDGVAAFADAGEGYAGEDGNAYAGDGVQNQAELGEGYAGEGGGGDGREGGEGYAGEGGDGVEGEEGEGYAGEGGDGDAGEGYAGERGDGVAGEEEEGYAGEGGDGVAAEEGEEYAGEGGDGVAGEEGEGYAGEGGDGVAREEGEGYASEGGDGVAREEGEGYAGEGGDGVAGEEGEGYAGEGGGGVAGEEDQCDGENGAAGDGGEGGEPAQPHSHGAEDDDDIENIMYPGAQAMATQQSQASTMDEDVEEQRALERGNVAAKKKYQSNPGKRVEWGEAEGEVGVTEMSAEVSAEVSAEAKGGEEDEGEREAEGEAEREEEGGPEVGEVVAMGRVEDASKGEGEGEAAIGVADKELVVAEAELLARDGGEVGEQQVGKIWHEWPSPCCLLCQRVNSAGGSTGQPNHTQRGWGPMASAGGGRAGAQPGGSNMGDRSQSNASGGGMNGVALGAAPSGRSSGSRGPDAAASTGSQRPVAVPRPGIGAGMPRPRAVASVSEKIAQNTYATMADLQALRDELLGQLCRRCAGCDRHDANGEGGGTQVEPVKEPVRVKSPEEIACDFINAETGGWQSHCKARKILTCSFPPISVSPLPYSLPGRANARHGSA